MVKRHPAKSYEHYILHIVENMFPFPLQNIKIKNQKLICKVLSIIIYKLFWQLIGNTIANVMNSVGVIISIIFTSLLEIEP